MKLSVTNSNYYTLYKFCTTASSAELVRKKVHYYAAFDKSTFKQNKQRVVSISRLI